MKRFFTAIILLFFCSAHPCFAFSELYYFKNIKTSDVEPLVNIELQNQSFSVVKQNPFYATSQNGNDYAVIILQQSGNNMFYYYRSDKNTKINKNLLKEIKKRDVIVEQSFNSGIISIYDELSENIMKVSGTENMYSFEDEEVTYTVPAKKQQVQKPQTYSGYIAQLNSGTKMNAYLQNSINTASANKGDRVIAVLSDGILYNGDVVIPQGSVMYGTLSKARQATYGSRNGKVVINFNQLVTPDNQVYDISTEEIDFTVTNDGKFTESVKNVATSAAVGALVGLLFGLIGDGNAWKSTAIGAGVGAGSSLVYSTAEKGIDAEIPSFTELEVVLTSPLRVSVSR